MPRLPISPRPHSSSSSSAPPFTCIRCLRRRRLSVSLRRQSAFLASARSHVNSQTPQQQKPSLLSKQAAVPVKRNWSQLAANVEPFASPTWISSQSSALPPTLTPPAHGISQDFLDRAFERSPLWQPRQPPKLINPIINPSDPEGIKQYLLQGTSIPKNTVELLTVLDALIAQDDLPRAAAVVASLKKQLDPSTPLSTLVYNKYLEGIVSTSLNESAGIGRAMEWFQEMIDTGVKPDRTSFALLSKAAFALISAADGNRAARKVFGLWRSQGGDLGDLLCDLMFPQEEILRSLKLNKMSLVDISDGYRTVLEIIVKTVPQTQTVLPDHQPARAKVLPAVRQTQSKSPNLEFMRKSLGCLYSDDKSSLDRIQESLNMAESADIFADNYEMAKQRQLEEGAYASAVEVWKYEMNEAKKRGDVYAGRLGIRSLAWDWVQAMKPVLLDHIEQVRPYYVNSEGKELVTPADRDTEPARLEYIWLTALPVEKLCAVTIMEVIRAHISEVRQTGCKAGALISEIGRAVEREMQAADLVRKENRGLLPKHLNLRQLFARKLRAEQYASQFHKQLVNGGAGVSYWPFEWRQDIRAKGAAVLVSSLLETAMIEMTHTDETGTVHSQMAPAFYHTYAYVRGKKVGMIKPNKFLAERLSSTPPIGRGIATKLAPMLVPPKTWTSWDDGGYWYTREEIMRTRQSVEQRAYLREASETGALRDVYRGLDILGETCWTINRRVFDVVIQVWNSGGAIADIPALASDLQYPAQPTSASWDVKERMKWIQECRMTSRAMQNAHSQRCDLNYKLEIARAFLGKKLYFPHSLDFRGRAYPVPPYFNHLGNDLCRGLLLFHQGKPLGEKGVRWLKIHLANVYGLDKLSLSEREDFTMKSLDNIFDSADHPLDGKRWWLNADDPWQCLATCFELTAALRSEDPHAYVCHLPVHQDGSCNGLQHYAALGGDLEGAKQVNLEPSDRPQDVYSGVAELVTADVERQANEGNEIAQLLKGKITRKIVKQTVMTNVYGVTFVGAKAQIYRALKDRGDLEPSALHPASDIIARSTFRCLADMFRGAHEIQEWLKECARRITKSLGPKDFKDKGPSKSLPYLSSVLWTTPLGLPVCQPYRKQDTKTIQTLMSGIFLINPNSIGPVNSRKQTTAFPPNFIHSLDASHMLMSAIACHQAGLTFAAVYDSFWTHAADVDVMNVVLREAFIEMHQGDLVGKLRDEFVERYQGHYYLAEKEGKRKGESGESGDAKGSGKGEEWKPLEFPPIPKKGEFDVTKLKNSVYFFS